MVFFYAGTTIPISRVYQRAIPTAGSGPGSTVALDALCRLLRANCIRLLKAMAVPTRLSRQLGRPNWNSGCDSPQSVGARREFPPGGRLHPVNETSVMREVAKWLRENAGQVIEGVAWLDEFLATIESYLDPPKTLEELQQGVSTPKKGYDIHHIVEQTSAEKDGFPRSIVDAPENLVRIPRMKHWEINAWYTRKNQAYGKLCPREYLRGQSWGERQRVGLQALIEYGVLRP